MGSVAWKVLAAASSIAAGKAATTVTAKGWKAATGGKPPVNKHDPNHSATQIAVFAVVSTAMAAGFKAFAERKAADYYTRSTGTPPPAVAKQQQKAATKAALKA
ncbi:DUF4235 domain-containing protein [Rudaeicoccus suwonensis]|uniref:Uncharacterized protein DUF4235 n=1 Tax=Rudaeicoccus suwonensis TaxID=657409 RepID=A0A561E3D1_9MICO|nr:DUF4235 domain-containing protein [Rudaeicoccus suwonensis]TWE10122.1 uncharacterized protein DUF4235 [Rudaeicoccus suwonensis]